MYRIVNFGGYKYYALKIKFPLSSQEEENIETFINEGTPVILVNEIEDLDYIGLAGVEVEIVESE